MAYKPSFTVTFDENVDYAQMKEDAIAAGDYRRAAMAELSRNLKIEQTGSQYPQTHDFGSALDIDMMTDEELKEAYEARQAAGRTRDWAAANELVENIRARHGYTCGPDGSQPADFSTDPGVDYASKMQAAIDAGDWRAAAGYEQMRNAKIDAGYGQDYGKTQWFGSEADRALLSDKELGEVYNIRKEVLAGVESPGEADWTAAHDAVEDMRAMKLYSGGADGMGYAAFDPARDYETQINDAIGSGDFKLAANYEVMRNAKIAEMGLSGQYPETHRFGTPEDVAIMSNEDLAECYRIRLDAVKAADGGRVDWTEAHDRIEAIRQSYGYTGGADGGRFEVPDAIYVERDEGGYTSVDVIGTQPDYGVPITGVEETPKPWKAWVYRNQQAMGLPQDPTAPAPGETGRPTISEQVRNGAKGFRLNMPETGGLGYADGGPDR